MSQILKTVAEAVCGTSRANNPELSELQAERIARSAILATLRATLRAIRDPTAWRALRKPSYVAACRQTNCAGRGFEEGNSWQCAYCADIADDIIETHAKASVDALLLEVEA